MAQFKISLIVPNNDDKFQYDSIFEYYGTEPEKYVINTITDFTDQEQEYNYNKNCNTLLKTHTYSYTYNEKLSKHKNGQQELSFAMDDKIEIDGELVENPFARILRTGVQIELQDKYDNIRLFTVNKISHKFNNINLVYEVTCQDSFTYQLNRQNAGYNLTNDENSRDFIGALDIDTWAQRIVSDCYITYRYVPLDTGLFMDQNGIVSTFEVSGDDVENSVELKAANVKKILKPIYNRNDYEEFYDTFPFSASGSSANAALIALADTLGLQLNIIEGLKEYDINNPGKPRVYNRFFFFGPTKNPNVSGLTYSPLRDIQNFSLSFSGDPLTTVLNVNSTSWEDEEIGLLPSIPSFFNQLFMDGGWKDSVYYPGFFLEAVSGKNYGGLEPTELLVIPPAEQQYPISGHYYIQLKKTFIWKNYYKYIRFYWEDKEHYTYITNGQNNFYNPFADKHLLGITFGTTIDPSDPNYDPSNPNFVTRTKIYYQYEEIDTQDINNYNENSNIFCYLVIPARARGYSVENFYFTLTRDYTKEEIEFATIAEECPWLENKLIDFSYFVRQGVLSKAEYEGLMHWLLNDLRRINGQLICYSNAYFMALKDQVDTLSKIQESLDMLGAEFYADIVEPYQSGGDISSNVKNFVNSYEDIFSLSNLTSDKKPLMNLDNLITDCLNKYFDAEQRFLKNIYEFRKYFNDTNIYSLTNNNDLQEVTYQIENTDPHSHVLFSFDGETTWDILKNNSNVIVKPNADSEEPFNEAYPTVPLYIYKDKHFIQQKIPNAHTYKDFYVPLYVADHLQNVPDQHYWNSTDHYYYLYKNENHEFFKDKFGYEPLPEQIVDFDGIEYVSLLPRQLKQLFVQQQIETQDFYVRDTETLVPFEWVRCNADVVKNAFSLVLWPGISAMIALNPTLISNTASTTLSQWVDAISMAAPDTVWALYKAMLPVEEIYIKDYDLRSFIINTDGNIVYEWKLYDEIGNVYTHSNNKFYKQTITKNDAAETVYGSEEVPLDQLYTKYYSVPFLSYNKNASSLLFNASNETTVTYKGFQYWLDIANTIKNKKYYVCYEDTTTKGWVTAAGWIGFGLGILCNWPLAAVGIGLALEASSHQWAVWGQKDETTFNMRHPTSDSNVSDLSEWVQEYNTSSQYPLGNTTDTAGDSHWVNYVRAENSEKDLSELTKAWMNNTDLRAWLDESDEPDELKGYYKHYANYYKHIVATYSQGARVHDSSTDLTNKDLTDNFNSNYFLENDMFTPHHKWDIDKYFIKNQYGRFCLPTDKINYKDKYVWVEDSEHFNSTTEPDWPNGYIKLHQVDPEDDNSWVWNVGRRFSAIKFYPLVQNKTALDFDSLFELKELKESPTIAEYLDRLAQSASVMPGAQCTITYNENNGRITIHLQKDGKHDWVRAYIIHLEPYEARKIVTEHLDSNYPNITDPNHQTIFVGDATNEIYYKNTDKELVLNDLFFTTDSNFFYIPAQDDQIVPVKLLPEDQQQQLWDNAETHWYSTEQLESRTYSLSQKFAAESDCPYTYYYLGNSAFDDCEFINTNKVKRGLTICYRTYSLNEDEQIILGDTVETIHKDYEFIDDENEIIARPLTIYLNINNNTVKITRSIKQYFPISKMSNGEFWYFFHNRLDIPTILSKAAVIETQLTMHWQSAHIASNYCQWFLPEYWQNAVQSNNNMFASALWTFDGEKVRLLDTIIPQVEIYKEDNKTLLQGYSFHYHSSIDDDLDKEEYELKDVHLDLNPAVNAMVNHIFYEDILKENRLSRITAQKYSKHTYYYVTGGGLERKNVLHFLTNSEVICKHYDGLYCMQLNLLLRRYYNAPVHDYKRLANQKLLFWQSLYTRYPGIFLESTYSNEDARTSTQLLQLAQLAFKDYTAPEKQYNITLIDAAALEGYQGQELHIGDGILIRTSDYYNAVDETYRALNQYLFITDISYTLRKDDDISLTVNAIKYQEKLLQSLVKLIR